MEIRKTKKTRKGGMMNDIAMRGGGKAKREEKKVKEKISKTRRKKLRKRESKINRKKKTLWKERESKKETVRIGRKYKKGGERKQKR